MVRFNALLVLAFGLLAASVTCLDDRSSAIATQGSDSGVNTRDLLARRRRRRRRNKRKNAKNFAVNKNGEGVLINQQTDVDIKGDSNTVFGGQVAPIFNANVDIDEIEFDPDRKILSHDGGRDLLARRRRHRRRHRRRKGNKAVNINDEGVLINQQTDVDIKGHSNTVFGGQVAPIFNAGIDIDEIEFGHDRKILSQDGGRELLARRRRHRRRRNRRRKGNKAVNVNDEGVLVNQQTDADIYGDSNTVYGGVIYPVKNINVDVGEEEKDDH